MVSNKWRDSKVCHTSSSIFIARLTIILNWDMTPEGAFLSPHQFSISYAQVQIDGDKAFFVFLDWKEGF